MYWFIAYMVIWGFLTTAAVSQMPGYIPFLRIMIANSLFPIQWLLLPVTLLYRVLGVGVYFETSVLMTESEIEKLSDEIHSEDADDR